MSYIYLHKKTNDYDINCTVRNGRQVQTKSIEACECRFKWLLRSIFLHYL